MSSIFTFGTGLRSPTRPRRIMSPPTSVSPFCTSPTQLQEVTLDVGPLSAYAMGVRSPGKSSPLRVHSVKEYEEQLNSLMKENFNLKLRIFFLEERMGRSYLDDKDSDIKKNIELNVQIESLRKELQDKQELLCQAVKALELVEDENRKQEAQRACEAEQLNARIAQLEEELRDVKATVNRPLEGLPTGDFDDNSMAVYCEAFGLKQERSKTEREVEMLEKQLEQLEAANNELQNTLTDEKERSFLLETEVQESECLILRCNSLEKELDQRDDKLKDLVDEIEQKGKLLSACNLKIRTLEDNLASKESEVHVRDEEIDSLSNVIKEKQIVLDEQLIKIQEFQNVSEKHQRQIEHLRVAVKIRDSTISDLEEKAEKAQSDVRNLRAKLDSSSHEMKRLLKEIETLRTQQRRVPSKSKLNSNEISESQTPRTPLKSKANLNENQTPEVSPRLQRLSNSPRSRSSYSPSKGGRSITPTVPTTPTTNKSVDSSGIAEFAVKSEENVVVKLEMKLQEKEGKIKQLQEENKSAVKTIQGFMKRAQSLSAEAESLKASAHMKSKQIRVLETELSKVRSKFDADSIGSMGRSGFTFKVQDCTPVSGQDEEKKHSNEGADNDGPKQTDVLNIQRENYEMELQTKIQNLLQTIKLKEEELEKYENELFDKNNALDTKDNRIVELEMEIALSKMELSSTKDAMSSLQDDKKQLTDQIEIKVKENENLKEELRRRTVNLQEIVNKELWDKNREIERLQKRLRTFVEQNKVLHTSNQSREATSPVADNLQEEINSLRGQLQLVADERKHLQKKVEELKTRLRNTPERDSESRIVQQLRSELTNAKENLEQCEIAKHEALEVCTMLTTRLEELALFLDSLLRHKSVLGLLGVEKRNILKNVIEKSLDLSRTLNMSISLNGDQSLAQLSHLSDLLNTSGRTSINPLDLFEPRKDEDESNLSIVPDRVTVTYNSHLSLMQQAGRDSLSNASFVARDEEQERVIEALRSQVETLKREIQLRDVEINRRDVEYKNEEEKVPAKTSTAYIQLNYNNEDLSESEAWSEPDRSVSLARIGLVDDSLKTLSPGDRSVFRPRSLRFNEVDASTTESDDRTPTKRNDEQNKTSCKRSSFVENGSVLQERIKSLCNQVKEKDNIILSTQCAMLEMDNKIKQEKLLLSEQFEKLRKQKSDVEQLVKDAEEKVARAELKKQSAEKQFAELENMVVALMQKKDGVANDIDHSFKQVQVMREERDRAINDAQVAQKKADDAVAMLQESRHVWEQELSNRNEQNVRQKIKDIENKWNARLVEVQKEAECRIKELECKENELRLVYETDWIRKTDVQQEIKEIENAWNCKIVEVQKQAEKEIAEVKIGYEKDWILKTVHDKELDDKCKEIEMLKASLEDAELKVERLGQLEIELKNKLNEVENTNREKGAELKKELDEASVAISQAVLERTRFMNEKTKLEQQLHRLEQNEQNLKTVKEKLREQVVNLEQHKSELEIRISELESINADLHNRLVKLQGVVASPRRSEFWSKSAQTSPEKFNDTNTSPVVQRLAALTFNDDTERGDGLWFNRGAAHNETDGERVVNSSPDLGIDSDPGRFSSLEANVDFVRPLLHTLELTQSMNNLLTAAASEDNSADAVVKHMPDATDVQKLLQENIELRRRWLRTKRALEETVRQLSKSNERKRQVEKAVCRQIHKTSLVLRKARANLDSGSESETVTRSCNNCN